MQIKTAKNKKKTAQTSLHLPIKFGTNTIRPSSRPNKSITCSPNSNHPKPSKPTSQAAPSI
ncbi:hypothetical protein PRIP_13449 [Listeria riparia FSL S10-1204]|uniref:Uncharacterized protein n=1 Tax=Listeria riparia FSL S10-1204 TaxID=1265816 RepID=W7D317_9LIST|nr:hypothetical protein PRIP_13449 [Listeria riparia FSL S10-1204]